MKRIFLVVIVLVFHFITKGQGPQDILTIDGNAVSEQEFIRIYTKNNPEPAFDTASINEYLNLFINYKLKVLEARHLGYDTLSAFKQEFNGYVKQLEKPYFTDTQTEDELVKEAYERMKWHVKASHILITCDAQALPADTLKAYKTIASIRKQAVAGKNFEALAKAHSQDPSVANNGGDLGYFTVFSMVYPFETAAYNTKVGEVSEIVRTRFGYHILKVAGKKPNAGQVKVAHIMFGVPQGSNSNVKVAKQKQADQVYDLLLNGADFKEMAMKYSEDGGTKNKGGELPFFTSGRMIPEFEKVAFALKNIGDISKPVQTYYGYHIIQLLDKKPLGSFEELEADLKRKISKDVRAGFSKTKVLASLYKEYNAQKLQENLKPILNYLDSGIYKGAWKANDALMVNNPVFIIADSMEYSLADFARYLHMDGKAHQEIELELLLNKEYNKWCDNLIMDFESSRLPIKYPEFKHLVQEYHDGILLFNLTENMVWSKATKDTLGLEQYYQAVKQNYLWDERVSLTTYDYNNPAYTKKVMALAKKVSKKNLDAQKEVDVLLQKIRKKDTTFTMNVATAKFEKGANPLADSIGWAKGVNYLVQTDSVYTLTWINGLVQPEPKLLSEIRGLIMAEYQNYLDEQWIADLRKRYKVEINNEAVEAISHNKEKTN